MATGAEFTLPADEFPLGTVFSELPDVTIQLERVIPDANGVVPYFWVRETENDAVVEQFSDTPGVRNIREVDNVDGEHLLRCEWVSEHDSVLDASIAPEVVLLTTIGTADGLSKIAFQLNAYFVRERSSGSIEITASRSQRSHPPGFETGSTDTEWTNQILFSSNSSECAALPPVNSPSSV